MTTHKFLDCDKDRIEKTARETIKMADELRPFIKSIIAECCAFLRKHSVHSNHCEDIAFRCAWYEGRLGIARGNLENMRSAKRNARQALKDIGR